MIHTARQLTSLLSGVALLLMGTGLLGTLIPVIGGQLGFSSPLLGALTSAYFAGFLGGTFVIPSLVRRIGHIRAFAFCATTCACLVLLLSLTSSPWAWLVLRLGIGMALVGLYMVIESWLNSQAHSTQRSRVFALYMVVNLGALAASQQFLHLQAAAPATLFVLVTLLVCASTLPVLATRMRQPEIAPTPRLRLRRLASLAPSAAAAALLSGLSMGAMWGLGPVYAASIGLSPERIGNWMSVFILGGAALQWPMGRLSDRHDRRIMLVIAGAAGALCAAALPMLSGHAWLGTAMLFLFGGMAFSLYPIAVAHLLDYVPGDELLGASSSVLLVNGIGAAIGPLLAGLMMGRFGPSWLFVWGSACMAVAVLFIGSRLFLRQRDQEDTPTFQPMLRTTPTAMEMHPAMDELPPDASPPSGPH